MTRTVLNNSNDFCRHPIYDKWEANREGVVRHIENKKDVGFLTKRGYLQISVRRIYGDPVKNYLKHRFIFECFYGKINDVKLAIDHINNIKTDNRLENLQLVTQSQNHKKDHPKGKNRPSIPVQATNINSGETFNYDSLNKCSRSLDIHRRSITDVLDGIQKTATSKKDKNKYRFERL